MKKAAITALVLGAIYSTVSTAEDAPTITLALNSHPAINWEQPVKARESNDAASKIALEGKKTMETISSAMDKQLAEKMARQLAITMQQP